MPSVRAPLVPSVGPGVTGALVPIGTCVTLMVAPPRPTTGPFLVPGVNAIVAHAPGMAPAVASDPNVDPNLAPGSTLVDTNTSDARSVVNSPSSSTRYPPYPSPVAIRVSVMFLLFAVFLHCAGYHCLVPFKNISSSLGASGAAPARGEVLLMHRVVVLLWRLRLARPSSFC